MLDFVHIGSSLSLRSFGRLGSAISVLDFVHLGSNLALRSFARMGSACSILDFLCLLPLQPAPLWQKGRQERRGVTVLVLGQELVGSTSNFEAF